jgi:hypothetical protein
VQHEPQRQLAQAYGQGQAVANRYVITATLRNRLSTAIPGPLCAFWQSAGVAAAACENEHSVAPR